MAKKLLDPSKNKKEESMFVTDRQTDRVNDKKIIDC